MTSTEATSTETITTAAKLRRRAGAVVLGLTLVFGAAACGNSEQDQFEDLLSDFGISEEDIAEMEEELKDFDYEAWEEENAELLGG